MTSSSIHLTEQSLHQDQFMTENPRIQNRIIRLPFYNTQNRYGKPRTNLFKPNRGPKLVIQIGKNFKKSPQIQSKKVWLNKRQILTIKKKSVLKREIRNGSNCQNQLGNSLNQIQNRGQNSTLQSSPEGNDQLNEQIFEQTPVVTKRQGPSRVNSLLHQLIIQNVSLQKSLIQDQAFMQDTEVQTNEASQGNNESEGNSEDQDTQACERQTDPFPPLSIRDFTMKIQSPEYFSEDFEPAGTQEYSTFYEKTHLKMGYTNFYKSKIKYLPKTGLKILCLNGDYNVHSRLDKNTKKVYSYKITEQERATQLMNIIWQAMKQGVDVIVLQEIYTSTMRQELFVALQFWNHTEYVKYFYPNNLFKFQEYRGTIILTRHQVKQGQLRFDIKESQNQKKWNSRFPTQAFCEFDININGKWEKVCILSCHLRSNGATYSDTLPKKMRQRQIKCLQDFSKRFDRFYCIGDTNIPSSKYFKDQNNWVSEIFTDAVKSVHTQCRGTYLYLRKSKRVVLERNDRVWMKHQNFERTSVKIEYRDELLNSCKGLGLNPKQMLKQQDGKLTYISPTDHTILDITLSFN